MSLQYIIDRAQTIEVDRKRVVGQTMSRSQRLKTAERNTAQPWRFIITPPGKIDWLRARDVVEDITTADRVGEYEINFNHIGFMSNYQGDLNSSQQGALRISAVGTSSLTINSLPAVGNLIRTETRTVRAFGFNTARNDFLIPTLDYIATPNRISLGDYISDPVYAASGNTTIQAINLDYAMVNGVGYTQIVMGTTATANSSTQEPVTVSVLRDLAVSGSSVVFKKGDVIQPANSRYPYTVTETILRGTSSSVVVPLHRSIITSEGITLTNQALKIGNQCTWRVVVTSLPSYTFVQRNLIEYNGNFDVVERII